MEGAHLNAIDTLRSAGKYDAALDWCQRTITRFNRSVTATTALFDMAKIYLLKNDYEAVLFLVEKDNASNEEEAFTKDKLNNIYIKHK